MSKHIWADPGNERLAKLLGEPVTEPDYKKVADTLAQFRPYIGVRQHMENYSAAIALCERMAKGELVERSVAASKLEALREGIAREKTLESQLAEVREAAWKLSVTLSRLRPFMKLETDAQWESLEIAHNRLAVLRESK